MDSSENPFVSESHAYIFMKHKFKVSQIIEILYKSKNWVIKWSVCGETGEFSWSKENGRPINLCFWSVTGNDVMIVL